MLTTLKDVHEQLGIATAVTGADAFFTSLIARATAEIEHICQRKFDPASYIEWHKVSPAASFLFVDQYPVIAVSQILIASWPGSTLTTILDPSKYVIAPHTCGKIFLRPGCLRGDGIGWGDEPCGDDLFLNVQYDAGMAETDPDLENICLRYVVALYMSRNMNAFRSSETVTSYTETLRAPKEVQDALLHECMPHRKPVMI